MAEFAHIHVKLTEKIVSRAQTLEQLGFAPYDALHLASAESKSANVFLTTDDRLLLLAHRNRKKLNMLVANPLDWLEEVP